MDLLDLQGVQDQLKAKQMALKTLDSKLTKELTKKQLLEQIYQNTFLNESQSSIQNLSQSCFSSQSSSSVNSSFLKKQIANVYKFTNNQSLNQINLIRKEINATKNTEQHVEYFDSKKQNKSKSISFEPTKYNEQTTLDFINPNFMKVNQLLQEKRNRERQMLKILQLRQTKRKQELQRQRLQIRQQLLQEQANEPYRPETSHMQHRTVNPKGLDNNVLRIERTKALSHLLRQVRKGKQNTDKLLQKTHAYSYY